ncbi:MAG: hypothetical protein GF401_17640 [Chitinivibrionales bacterium]|nr:hypothetical protein [Chitinivibrionales bacterium]
MPVFDTVLSGRAVPCEVSTEIESVCTSADPVAISFIQVSPWESTPGIV